MSTMPMTRPMGRYGLGRTLEELTGMGVTPPAPYADVDLLPPPAMPKKPGFMAPGSKGAMIAGIIGDTLASVSGGQPVFTMNMMQERQRKADAEAAEARWHRQRQAGREDKQWEWQNRTQEDDAFTRMVRMAGVDPNSAEGRALFRGRVDQQAREPDVVVTLPNGQLYIGPKSGIGAALGGGATAAPPAPVGKLTPIDGGPGGSPSGAGFRP